MTPYLLVDFGTTSIKSALVDLDTGFLTHPRQHAAVPASGRSSGRSEVPLVALRERFLEICQEYSDAADTPLAGVQVCSEMHGFAVLDPAGNPATPYIGWRDARCTEPLSGESTLDLVAGETGGAFHRITGMQPRAGLALLNLIHLGRQGLLPPEGQVVSLPGWLARCSGMSAGIDHATLLAAMAVYDIQQQMLAPSLLQLVRDMGSFLARFDTPATIGRRAGWCQTGKSCLPVFVGAGDHQTSVLGAGLLSAGAVSLNLGTGSQVSILTDHALLPGVSDAAARGMDSSRPGEPPGKPHGPSTLPATRDHSGPDVETRPYFAGRMLHTVTHVPAGRALNSFMALLQETAGNHTDLWARMAQLSADQVQAADLHIDLRVFPGSGGGRRGGSIDGITESNLTLTNYLASLLRCFCAQYPPVCCRLDPAGNLQRCLLSGGLARSLPVVARILELETGYEIRRAAPLDESLLGLRALALVDAQRASDPLASWPMYGSTCQYHESSSC